VSVILAQAPSSSTRAAASAHIEEEPSVTLLNELAVRAATRRAG
jgi:hypothetical protein